MARSFTIFSVVVVAFIAIQMSQMVVSQSQEIPEGGSCDRDTASRCAACPTAAEPVVCCNGLVYGQAKNGTVWAISSGECDCCEAGDECRTDRSYAIGTTDNTSSDAYAYIRSCQPISQG